MRLALYEMPAQQPDLRPRSILRHSHRRRSSLFLAGPWLEHAQALAQVDAVRRFAETTDPRAVWMSYGTARQTINGEPIKSALGPDPKVWIGI